MKTSAHAAFELQFHLVLVTKYRKKVLTGEMLTHLETHFGELLEGWRCRLLEFGGEPEMILSGKTYCAAELHELGLVDAVVEDGQGASAVSRVVDSVQPRLRGALAALRIKSRVAAISREALDRTVDEWAATALALSDRDLRLMERLVRAQLKKVGGDATGGAIEELKRMELEEARASHSTQVPA